MEPDDYTLCHLVQLAEDESKGLVKQGTVKDVLEQQVDIDTLNNNPVFQEMGDGAKLHDLFNELMEQRRWHLKYLKGARERFNKRVEDWDAIHPDMSYWKVKPWYDPGCWKEMVAYNMIKGASEGAVGGFLLFGGMATVMGLIAESSPDVDMKFTTLLLIGLGGV